MAHLAHYEAHGVFRNKMEVQPKPSTSGCDFSRINRRLCTVCTTKQRRRISLAVTRDTFPPATFVQELSRDAPMDAEYDAIIIGGGVGGLTSAAQMVARGLQVLVLEKYLVPGGSASHFKRQGYTFDVGSSMMFGFGNKGTTNLTCRALGAVNKQLETVPDPTQIKYHLPASQRFPQGLKLTVGRSREEFLSNLVSLFPHEAEGIHKFYGICWDIFNCLNTLELKSLEEPLYLAEQFVKHPLACLRLVPHLTSNTGDVAAKFIKDPELLRLIDAECFVFSTVPASHTPIINAGMVLSGRFYGHINYPRGGVGKIPQALAEGLVEHGGAVVYGAHVRNIMTEDVGGTRKAVGVKLTDGREFKAKALISNATRWDTFERMVGEENMSKSETLFRTRYKRAPSFFSLHMGVDASVFPQTDDQVMDVHHIILDDWAKLQEPFGLLFLSMPSLIDPSVAPAGKHVVHAFTSDWMDNWQGLNGDAYAAKKQEKANELTRRLEAVLPGLCGAIDMQEAGTPKTHRRHLGRNGGTYGPIPSRKPLGIIGMPFNRTSIKVMVDLGHLPALPRPVDDAYTSTLQFFRDRA